MVSESRYAGRDSAVIAVEGISKALLLYLLWEVVQLRASAMDVLSISLLLFWKEITLHQTPFYYYIGANEWWVLIPLLISYRSSGKKICETPDNVETKTKKKIR
ncbi:hypothetical protein YC2023_075582 [Brassica napus]